MFKRVERRIRKKEKEEELGLDEETKEILGLNAADTNSDESDSSSGSEGGSENEDQEPGLGEDEDASDTEEDDMGGDEEEEDEDEEDEPPMSVSEALQDPLWHVSLEPEVKACAVCPGKLLKNAVMIKVHIKSGAHRRRFTKLREAAMNVDPETEVRDLVRAQCLASQVEKPAEGHLSKRAEKKKAKLAAIKAKRTKQKVMKAKYRAKKQAKEKAAAENDPATSESEDGADASPAKPPATKKRRMDRDRGDEDQALMTAASNPARKQKPSMGKTGSRALRPVLASPKAVKPLKKSISDPLSNRLERPTAKSKQNPPTKSGASPLNPAIPKDSKIMRKRKQPDTAS